MCAFAGPRGTLSQSVQYCSVSNLVAFPTSPLVTRAPDRTPSTGHESRRRNTSKSSNGGVTDSNAFPPPSSGRSGRSPVQRCEPAVVWFERKIVRYVLLWGQFGALATRTSISSSGCVPSRPTTKYNRIINVLRASERLLESGDRELSRARRYEAQVQRGRPQVNRRAT